MSFPTINAYSSGSTYSEYGRLYAFADKQWVDKESLLPMHHWTMGVNYKTGPEQAVTSDYLSDSGYYPLQLVPDGGTILAGTGKVNLRTPRLRKVGYRTMNDYTYISGEQPGDGSYTFNGMTISFWFYFSTGYTNQRLISVTDGATSGSTELLTIISNYSAGTISFSITASTSYTFSIHDMTVYDPDFPDFVERSIETSVWHHISVGFSYVNDSKRSVIFLYYDGALVGEYRPNAVLQFLFPNTAHWWLNLFYGNLGISDTFTLDDIRVYPYRITEHELSAIYNQGQGSVQECIYNGFPTRKPPKYWFKMQENPGVNRDVQLNGTYSSEASVNLFSSVEFGSNGPINRFPDFAGNVNIQTSNLWNFGGTGYFSHNSIRLKFPDTNQGLDKYRWSVAFWFNPINFESNGPLVGNSAIFNSPANYGEFFFALRGNDLYMYYYSSSEYSINLSTIVNQENWYHACVVIVDNTVYLYLDGKLYTVNTTGQLPNPGNVAGLYVGTDGNQTSVFNGRMLDVRLYDYDLTQAEVKNIFNGDRSEDLVFDSQFVKGRLY